MMKYTVVLFAVLAVLCSAAADPIPLNFNTDTRLSVLVHLQNIGDRSGKETQWLGTKGQSRRLEGFSVTRLAPDFQVSIRYRAHIQNQGDTPVMTEGQFVGTRGQALRLEGFAIWLVGPLAYKYSIYYECHLQGSGDSTTYQDGGFCGTRGQSRRVEALRVWIRKK